MLYSLTVNDMKLIEKASKLTGVEYEINVRKSNTETFLCIIEDLIEEIKELNGKVKDLEEDLEESGDYKSYNPYANLDISERDFL